MMILMASIWLFGAVCIFLGMVLGYNSRELYDEKVKEVIYMKAINEDLVDKLNIKDEIIRKMNEKKIM